MKTRTAMFAVFSAALAVMGCGKTDPIKDGAKDGAKTGGAEGEEIVVGHYGSLNGDTAQFGRSADNGIKLAVEEINAAGGVTVGDKKHKVKLFTEDTVSDPTKVENAVTRLIERKPVAILGEVASSRSIRGSVICEQNKIPMISPASTNPTVTVPAGGKVREFTFRVCFTDDFQGAAGAVFGYRDLGWRKVGLLIDKDEDYSKGLAENFRKTFVRFGGKESDLVERFYSGKDTDFSAQLTVFKDEKVDGLYVPGYYQNITGIAQQVRAADIKGKGGERLILLGADGWDAKQTIDNSKGTLEGCFFTNHLAPDDPQTPEEKAFFKNYNAEYGNPDSMAPLGYDAMKLLADAITRAGSTDPIKVRDAIAATKNFQGVTGVITIDADHNADKPMVVVKISKNKFMMHSRIPRGDAMPAK